jgi:hypothetical protein
MLGIDLKAGDTFTWANYPLYINEFKSRRLPFYLGNYKLEAVVYQIITTTQFQHYENNGNHVKNNFFKIPAGVGGLEKGSILDITAFLNKFLNRRLINANEY